VLLFVVSLSVAGYFYYSSQVLVTRLFAKQAVLDTDTLENRIASFLTENLKTAKVLSEFPQLRQALLGPDSKAMDEANQILDHFQKGLGVEVCYLMGHSGNTLTATNRGSTFSFVGKSYGFRPYFKDAIAGKPSVYLALGVTSKDPGAYYSYPVYDDTGKSALGVVVIKAPFSEVKELFNKTPGRIAFLIDPHGMIFMTDSQEWLYSFLWKPSEEQKAEVEKSRQFGKGPWSWAGFEQKGPNTAVDGSGYKYILHQKDLQNYRGWKVVTLNSHFKTGA
jgi:C4-dicarboxylate-specific signal transduction histidine kinase